MRVFVTGATGFIGSAIVGELIGRLGRHTPQPGPIAGRDRPHDVPA